MTMTFKSFITGPEWVDVTVLEWFPPRVQP